MEKDLKAVILAAGKGTRMKSGTPKVLHEIFNKPLIARVLDNISFSAENIVVIGHGASLVKEYLDRNYPKTKTVLQKEQLGTGHALKIASFELEEFKGNLLVLCGDTPLIRQNTLEDFVNFHNENRADITVMSAVFDNPRGYGRIVRDNKGNVKKIVEEKDADLKTKQIKEINAGIYCFNFEAVKKGIDEIKNQNAQGEYYITDLIKWGAERSKKVCLYVIKSCDEIFGINSKKHLAQGYCIMKERKLSELMDNGVTIVDPHTTSISPETEIEPDTVILPSVVIEGKNKIGKNCKIGPFTHLRGGCEIEDFVKLGNFVELKNAKVKSGTNICHLSYVGDSSVGSNVNIGAGTITANYDSRTKIKSRTKINDNASIGSNCVLVAPVEIGENSLIGAGSVITKNVDDYSLGLCRAAQKEIKNYIKKGEIK
ncbi:MAG: NTP transferase domain-containing protein [Candidatus Gastranaerophilales bacterium]|nr:NTP transferase domain-containing protein [Candidatus Gastranaerophilales bacterium]